MSDGFDPILQQAEQRRLREQVLWRLGIAAGLIAIVLSGIYLLDRPDEKPRLETPNTPRIAPPLNPPQASDVAATPIAASEVSGSEVQNAPTPFPTPSPTTVATSSPQPASATMTSSATSIPIRGKAPAPIHVPTSAPVLTPPPSTPSPTRTTTISPNTSRRTPAENLLQPQLAGPNMPEAIRGPNGYSVQAGVFLHADNAEKLLQQLQTAGIPAYLETRVQIGPFKNKADADAAARKLRALGIEPILKSN